MERNREARRGTPAANGGLSRRRQRSSSLRDSPEEDGGMEMAETTRLRDRVSKKDRDRDRSSRSKRRRGERMLHGSNKDERDDSSDESVEEEEEDDVSVAIRLPPPPPPPNPTFSSSSLSPSNNHQHQQNRKSLPIKVTKTPPVWKADEMIGFSVPRKARSASTKRSHECWVSGGSGSGEQIPRQASTSPSRLSPASTTQISPSSNASARKKMKSMSGSKHRPLKGSKSPSSIQDDIEIEVAEVLYGMTKQFQCAPKQETPKIDSKDTTGGSCSEAKSRISSPNSISPAPPASLPSFVLPPSNFNSNPTSLPTAAPRRKKPRPVKLEEERSSSPGGLLAPEASKMEPDHQMKEEASSPRSEKNTACPSSADCGGSTDVSVPPVAAAAPVDVQQESVKIGNNPGPDSKLSKGEPDGQNHMEIQEEPTPAEKGTPFADLDVNHREETTAKAALASDSHREEKLCIDLMVPPRGKLSPERDSLCEFDADHKSQGLGIEMALKVEIEKKDEKAVEKTAKVDEFVLEDKKVDNSMQEEFDLKKKMVKETTLDLQIDLENPARDSLSNNKLQLQKRQQKAPLFEPKQEKAAPSASPHAMPMTIAGWPSLPPFGYMGQVPSLKAVVPMDGTKGISNGLQPPSILSPQPRPKRCVTHCYIAQNIYYHQGISRMNTFWPAAAGTAPLHGAKPHNLNVFPSSDGKNTVSSQDNKEAPVVAAFKGPPSKDRMPAANNPPAEAAEKKQLVLQQMPQSGSATNMLHDGPTFIFPVNQQQTAAAATRSGPSKSTPGSGNGAPSSGSSSSATVCSETGGGLAATMNLSFTGVPPNEAQYVAILQNNAYPFPIPAHVAGPPPFRGASPAQAMPFFNGPFFSSQMLHPSQLQQQQLLGSQQPPRTQQQSHQHASTLSGSSSSQKHSQPLQALGGGANGAGGCNYGFPAAKQQHQARRREGDKPLEDGPSTTDGRNYQAQKNVYAHNFAMPIHPQNFTLMPAAAATAAALGGGGGHGDKLHMQQQPQLNQRMKVELASSQAFAMPFISFNGVAAAPPGLDFSSMAQNQAFFQALPEGARHGYGQIATAAVAAATAAAAQAAQMKKTHPEDGKSSGGDSISAKTVSEEERRMIAAGSKAPGSSLQHSFCFSTPDGGPPFSSMLGNGVMDSSSRTLGLIPAPSNCSSGAASITTSAAEVPVVNIPNSQQQQFLQLQQQQQQQQLQMQHQLGSMKSSGSSNSPSVCSERLPAGSTGTKFPQTLAGFPQALIQGGSPSQAPQWKASITRAATPASPQSSAQPVAKNNPPPQQQSRAPQQSFPAQSHQTQISFCLNSTKAVPAGGTSNPPSSSASAIAIASSPNSVSKSANPRPSASLKLGSSAGTLSLPQQSSAKSCGSSSGRKSSPVNNNRNATPIHGHPHITPNSSTKPQQQQGQQSQKQQQPFPQAQFFFSNPYMQAQPPQSNAGATAAAYYQRRPSELQPSQPAQQQQFNLTPGSSGMLAVGSSTLTTEPSKAAATAANGMKGMPSPGLHAPHLAVAAQSATGSPHPLMPPSFPYLSVPEK